MKKLFIVALAALVSACACFDCEDEAPVTTYQSSRQSRMDCDYFDGRTCYRYTYRNIQRPVVQPVVYREQPRCPRAAQQVQYQPRPCNNVSECPRAVRRTTSNCGCASCGCAGEAKVSETREPVEIVYKKVTTKTVYEPRTYAEVSYEKTPYNSVVHQAPAEVIQTADTVTVDEIK